MEPETTQLLNKILNEPRPLSQSQKDAVLSKNRYVRIIAGAGAGKTETLTRKIVKLLLVDDMPPSAIVAFTFTEKAAQSMKSRIYERVKQMGGDEQCVRLGEMFIGTIHAYCFRLLEDHFSYGGYGSLDTNQEMAFLLRFGWNLHLTGGHSHSENCEIFMQNLNMVYAEMIPDAVLKQRAPDFFNSLKSYEHYLTDHKRLTFNRMIKLAVEHLQHKPDTLSHIQHLIVDEYQDINRAQEKLIQLIGKNGSIFIVGDPRQTIFQFRGSNAGCFDSFDTTNPDVETLSITENRRSAKSIVSISNRFADSFTKQHYDHLTAVRADAGGVYLGQFHSNISEAEWIANQIHRYVKEGKCSFGDIGILMRSVSTSGPVFIDVFRRRHIPFIVGGKVGLFRRSEIQAVGKLIAWLSAEGFFQKSPWDRKDVLRGDDLLNQALIDWRDAVPEIPLADNVVALLQEWKTATMTGHAYKHFTEMYYAILTLLGYNKLDPDNPEHAVIMANLGRFGELLTDFETANRLGGRKIHWETDMKNLTWFMNSFAMSSYEEQTSDDVREVDAVQLMTLHQSKGLEWDLVFLPAIVQGRFPSSRVGWHKTWLVPRELFDVVRYEGDMEAERKLMYVGLTRAKDLLVVSTFDTLNNRKKSTSEFLEQDLDIESIPGLRDSDSLPMLTLSPSGNTDDIQTFSAGELVTYGKCPYMYRLNAVWGYQPGLSEYLGYGTALHFCMRVAAEQMKEGYSAISAVAGAVDRHFFLPFADVDKTAKVKDEAKKRLIKFSKEHDDDMKRIREVETRIEYPMQNANVVGKVDVIMHDGEGIEIRDYKTSDQIVTDEESAMQVRLYARGLALLGEKIAHGSVAYLEDASIRNVEVKENDLRQAEKTAQDHIEGIKRREFKPCSGESCKKCNYGVICKWSK
jgi:DNA helicase-2/ATP-dependent DNA helicase PcrA